MNHDLLRPQLAVQEWLETRQKRTVITSPELKAQRDIRSAGERLLALGQELERRGQELVDGADEFERVTAECDALYRKYEWSPDDQ